MEAGPEGRTMSNVIHILTGRSIDPETGVMPHAGECLACFVHRMVGRGRCSDTLGWAEHYRLARARRAVALTRRLTAQGACCDCTVVRDLWRPSITLWSRDAETGDLVPPVDLPPCRQVRTGSTRPCAVWVPAASLAL
jgi:hypothetical protein